MIYSDFKENIFSFLAQNRTRRLDKTLFQVLVCLGAIFFYQFYSYLYFYGFCIPQFHAVVFNILDCFLLFFLSLFLLLLSMLVPLWHCKVLNKNIEIIFQSILICIWCDFLDCGPPVSVSYNSSIVRSCRLLRTGTSQLRTFYVFRFDAPLTSFQGPPSQKKLRGSERFPVWEGVSKKDISITCIYKNIRGAKSYV